MTTWNRDDSDLVLQSGISSTTVGSVRITGTTIGHTGDTDILNFAANTLTLTASSGLILSNSRILGKNSGGATTITIDPGAGTITTSGGVSGPTSLVTSESIIVDGDITLKGNDIFGWTSGDPGGATKCIALDGDTAGVDILGPLKLSSLAADAAGGDYLIYESNAVKKRTAAQVLVDIGISGFGISDTNVTKCGSGIADDDFIRVNGTTFEGRSASEVLSDIGISGFGISDTNVTKCGAGIVDDDFIRVNGTTFEGRSASEVLSDIGGQTALTFGIADANVLRVDHASAADNDYAKFTANGLEGRSTSEVQGDLSIIPDNFAGLSELTTVGDYDKLYIYDVGETSEGKYIAVPNLKDYMFKGGDLYIKDGAANRFFFDCDNTAFTILDDQDNGDLFKIQVNQHGRTDVVTIDDDAAAAHVKFDIDGHTEFDCGVGFDRKIATFSTSGEIGDGNDSTDVDFRLSNKFTLTLTDNISGSSEYINMIFPATSGNFLLTVTQDGTGSRTVAAAGWRAYAVDETLCDNLAGTDGTDGAVRWAGGTAPTLTTAANKTDIISIYWDSDSQTAFAVPSLNF